MELDNKQLNVYAGNYDNFIASKQQVVVEAPKQQKPTSNYRNAKQRAVQTNRAKRLKELENLITKLEQEIEYLQNQMNQPYYPVPFEAFTKNFNFHTADYKLAVDT